MHPNRLGSNRGNAYINPLGVAGSEIAKTAILPSFDCKNTGVTANEGQKAAESGTGGSPACRIQGPYVFKGKAQAFPRIEGSNYSRGR